VHLSLILSLKSLHNLSSVNSSGGILQSIGNSCILFNSNQLKQILILTC
ncbi:unnamed protein product, partial [Larinioides sclopetarius]